jgi:hypothetical protein
MYITLRDFRSHVSQLEEMGHKELAVRLAQEYLDKYANGLNIYVGEVQRITNTSRETKLIG